MALLGRSPDLDFVVWAAFVEARGSGRLQGRDSTPCQPHGPASEQQCSHTVRQGAAGRDHRRGIMTHVQRCARGGGKAAGGAPQRGPGLDVETQPPGFVADYAPVGTAAPLPSGLMAEIVIQRSMPRRGGRPVHRRGRRDAAMREQSTRGTGVETHLGLRDGLVERLAPPLPRTLTP